MLSAEPNAARMLRLPLQLALAALAVTATLAVTVLPLRPGTAAALVPVVHDCRAAPELSLGDRGADVRCLQFVLVLLGYGLEVNGEFDSATEAAVRRYQQAHPPLDVDGRAGPATLERLGIGPQPPPLDVLRATVVPGTGFVILGTSAAVGPPPMCLADADISAGESGSSVLCLQLRLTELGHYRGPAHGRFDAATQAALRDFQTGWPGLSVDGRGGPQTLAALGIWSGVTVEIVSGGPAFIPGPSLSGPSLVGSAGPGGPVAPGPFPAPEQPLPNWRTTPDGVPYYAGRRACTRAEADVIAHAFALDGADTATQQWAVYVASREAGCRHDAVNVNAATRDDSHCAFQLNALAGMFGSSAELGRRGWTPTAVRSSLDACADAASDLWVFCGRGPWTRPYRCLPPGRGG